MSHELRSPLTSVKGYTRLLLNSWSESQRRPEAGRCCSQVNHDADRVTRLINELLDISRLESGRLVLRRPAGRSARAGRRGDHQDRPRVSATSTPAWTSPPPFPRCTPIPDKVEQVLSQPGRERVQVRARRAGCRIDGAVARRRGLGDGDRSGRRHPERRTWPRSSPSSSAATTGRPARVRARAVDQPGPGGGPRRPIGGRVNCRARYDVSVYPSADRPSED